MGLAALFRWIPTPTYGKCGGAKKDCSIKPPIDPMDELFQEHDQNLYMARQLSFSDGRDKAEKEADSILKEGLKKIDPKSLSLYGRIYRRLAILVF